MSKLKPSCVVVLTFSEFDNHSVTDLFSHHVFAQFLNGCGSVFIVKRNLGPLCWLGMTGDSI